MNILENTTIFFIEFLKVCLHLINVFKLPTNPVTIVLYSGVAYYGYTKLKTRVEFDLKRWTNRLLVLVYSIAILGLLNFLLENVWLTAFYIKYTFFNAGGIWLSPIYFKNPYVWIINYIRNFCYIIGLFIVTRDILKHVHFNKKTLIGFSSISIYIFLFFFLSPNFVYVDWAYGLIYNFHVSTVITAFLISCLGKTLVFYTFYTLWYPKSD